MKINFFVLFIFFISIFVQVSCGGSRAGGSGLYKSSINTASESYQKDSPKDYRKKYSKSKRGLISATDSNKYAVKPGTSTRMIIYTADFIIIVNNVEKSMKEVEAVSRKYKGFIESAVSSDSYRFAKIIIRVPVKSFDAAIKDIEKLGSVENKEVAASDVTMEYNDLYLRVEAAKKVRARLYELLKRTKKVKDRVKILREIERLSTKIDSLESKLKYMKSRASYSTITLVLKAKTKVSVSRYIPSPFPWITGLNINVRSIYDSGDDIKYDAPAGFFSQKKQYYDKKRNVYLFSTPGDKAEFRVGVVKNYPPADFKFWSEAMRIDIKNRKYSIIKKFQVKGQNLIFRAYTLKPAGSSIYTVAFAVKKEKVIVVEARFNSSKDYKNHKNKLFKFIKSVRFN